MQAGGADFGRNWRAGGGVVSRSGSVALSYSNVSETFGYVKIGMFRN